MDTVRVLDERGVSYMCAEIDLRERESEYMSLLKRKSVFHCPEPFDGAHTVTYVSYSPPTPATPSAVAQTHTHTQQKRKKQQQQQQKKTLIQWFIAFVHRERESNLSLSLSMLSMLFS